MDDKKKRAIGVGIMAGLLCIGVVTGVAVNSIATPEVETETEIKETMTLTEKEYKSNGTFSVEDLKWSEDVSKYNPRFADGLASITYKADGEYAETVVLTQDGVDIKYDIVVKVGGVVTTTVPTTTITTTTKATEVPTTTQAPTSAQKSTTKATTKATEKATTKKTTKKATTTTKKAVTTTKKKVTSTTKATTSSDETGGVPILSDEESEAINRQHPNHPDNRDPATSSW